MKVTVVKNGYERFVTKKTREESLVINTDKLFASAWDVKNIIINYFQEKLDSWIKKHNVVFKDENELTELINTTIEKSKDAQFIKLKYVNNEFTFAKLDELNLVGVVPCRYELIKFDSVQYKDTRAYPSRCTSVKEATILDVALMVKEFSSVAKQTNFLNKDNKKQTINLEDMICLGKTYNIPYFYSSKSYGIAIARVRRVVKSVMPYTEDYKYRKTTTKGIINYIPKELNVYDELNKVYDERNRITLVLNNCGHLKLKHYLTDDKILNIKFGKNQNIIKTYEKVEGLDITCNKIIYSAKFGGLKDYKTGEKDLTQILEFDSKHEWIHRKAGLEDWQVLPFYYNYQLVGIKEEVIKAVETLLSLTYMTLDPRDCFVMLITKIKQIEGKFISYSDIEYINNFTYNWNSVDRVVSAYKILREYMKSHNYHFDVDKLVFEKEASQDVAYEDTTKDIDYDESYSYDGIYIEINKTISPEEIHTIEEDENFDSMYGTIIVKF